LASDSYVPWNLNAQKPSIRNFRLAKSKQRKIFVYERRARKRERERERERRRESTTEF
jgi:hypothetical protein